MDDFYYETQITVEKGKVTNAYKAKYMRGYYFSAFEMRLRGEEVPERQPIEEVPLSDEQIHSLTNLDVVYQFIKKLPNISPKKNYISFRIDSRGLILRAGYALKGCADDCFRGYHIKSLTPLEV